MATGVKMKALQQLEAMNFGPPCTVARNTTMVGALAEASETMNPRQTARGKPDQEIHGAAGQ
eukprot:5405948-Pleurochrysis_carterae.AAC.1